MPIISVRYNENNKKRKGVIQGVCYDKMKQ